MTIMRSARRAVKENSHEEAIITRSLGRAFKDNDPSYGGPKAADMIKSSGANFFNEEGIRQLPDRPGVLYNFKNGTAEQYLRLVERIETRVYEDFGIRLIQDVKVIPHNGFDQAQLGAKGGIDLTPAKMNLQTKVDGNDSGGIKYHLDPAMLQQLQNAPGFVPVIINIQPLKDLRTFLET